MDGKKIKSTKGSLNLLFAGMTILTFFCLINISVNLAQSQWSPLSNNNADWLSQTFFTPSSMYGYRGLFNNYTNFSGSYIGSFNNLFSTPYGSSILSGTFPSQGLGYGAAGTGIYGAFNSLNTFGLYSSPLSWYSGGVAGPGSYAGAGVYGGPGGYPWSSTASALSPYLLSPFSSLSWPGGYNAGVYSPYTYPAQTPGGIYGSVYGGIYGGGIYGGIYGGGIYGGGIYGGLYGGIYGGGIYPNPQPSNCDPASAPGRMKGEWSSQSLKDESNNALKGELSIYRENDTGAVNMLDSSLSLGEGTLTEFNYTRTQGEAPISFKGQFYSGHTAEFSGIADNRLCCRNQMCWWAGVFEVEGNYTIKDNSGQVADSGAFSITSLISSSTPSPTPADAIKSLGKPYAEGNEVLSLTTGANGRIYGGTDIGCVNVGHMFVYDPATGQTTDLGNPGYECNAMTTGKDGLIYLGGGARSAGDHDCKAIGYANLAIYDPGKPWNPGNGMDANPRDLGQAVSFSGEVEGYPIVVHDLATAPDGRIYGCTGYRDGDEDEYYAHLFVYNPQTGQINDLGSPLSNQSSITRLAIAADGIIYGVILGPQTGYRPPPGKLFSYNPASATFSLINMPADIEGVIALTVGTDGLVYGAGGEINKIFTYDPASKSFDIKGNLGGSGNVLRMICAADGIIYIGCAVSGYFVRYDPTRAWQDSPQSDENDKTGVNPRVFHNTGKVNALTEGQNGAIYFGNLSGALFYFAGEE